MKWWILTVVSVVALSLGLWSCTVQVCSPGETQTCACSDGSDGAQACTDDGASWGACDCGESDDDDATDDDDDDHGDDDDTGAPDDDDTGPPDDDDTGPPDDDDDSAGGDFSPQPCPGGQSDCDLEVNCGFDLGCTCVSPPSGPDLCIPNCNTGADCPINTSTGTPFNCNGGICTP